MMRKATIALLTAYLTMAALAGCTLKKENDNFDPENQTLFTGQYSGYDVSILKAGYNKINLEDPETNELLVAFDNDKDGDFEEVSTRFAGGNKGLEALANTDSINKIYETTMFLYQYPKIKASMDELFIIKPDTLIFSEYGEKIGLNDINKDGNYDVIQYFGLSPGMYQLIVNQNAFDSEKGNRYMIVNKEGFDSTLQRSLNSDSR